jgi:regulatory protein
MCDDETITIKKAQKRGRFYYLSCGMGDEFKLEPEIYLKYNLTENSVVSRDSFFAIIDENCFRLCMNTAIRLLSQRMHSVYEIKSKLKKKGFSYKTINSVIDESEKLNLLNDEQFTKSYIEELIYRGQGKYKIINSLQKRGIAKEMIDKNLESINDSVGEEARAVEVMNKKMKSLAYKDIELHKLKEKLIRHLISRGFSSDIVFKIINKNTFNQSI